MTETKVTTLRGVTVGDTIYLTGEHVKGYSATVVEILLSADGSYDLYVAVLNDTIAPPEFDGMRVIERIP
jgi:thiamine monophosphate kinase